MDNKLKMFVWEDVLKDWTSGIMVALAHDVEEARALLREELGNEEDIEKEPVVYDTPKACFAWGGG